MDKQPLIAVALAAGAVLFAAQPAAAQEARSDRGLLVGGRLAANIVQRSQPNDPAGEPTVLYGTAFTGWEVKGGAALQKELTRLGTAPLLLGADLLISHARASGYAESRTTDARRELIISTTGVHLPILFGYGIEGDSTLLEFALGPEPMIGLASGSVSRQTGVTGPAQQVETRSVIHIGLTAKLGLMLDVAGGHLPIELRATWDPFVATTTRDRFDNFVDFENPGRYGVAFNYRFGISIGYLVGFGDSEEDDAPMGTPIAVEPEEESGDESEPTDEQSTEEGDEAPQR